MNNILQFMQSIRNPQQFVQNMMNNSQVMQNPMMKNAFDMLQRGDTQGLNKLVDNVAQQRGTSLEEIKKMLGI